MTIANPTALQQLLPQAFLTPAGVTSCFEVLLQGVC